MKCGTHGTEGWLVEPEGRRVQRMTRAHAETCIREYRQVLGETWTFAEDQYLICGRRSPDAEQQIIARLGGGLSRARADTIARAYRDESGWAEAWAEEVAS